MWVPLDEAANLCSCWRLTELGCVQRESEEEISNFSLWIITCFLSAFIMKVIEIECSLSGALSTTTILCISDGRSTNRGSRNDPLVKSDDVHRDSLASRLIKGQLEAFHAIGASVHPDRNYNDSTSVGVHREKLLARPRSMKTYLLHLSLLLQWRKLSHCHEGKTFRVGTSHSVEFI